MWSDSPLIEKRVFFSREKDIFSHLLFFSLLYSHLFYFMVDLLYNTGSRTKWNPLHSVYWMKHKLSLAKHLSTQSWKQKVWHSSLTTLSPSVTVFTKAIDMALKSIFPSPSPLPYLSAWPPTSTWITAIVPREVSLSLVSPFIHSPSYRQSYISKRQIRYHFLT